MLFQIPGGHEDGSPVFVFLVIFILFRQIILYYSLKINHSNQKNACDFAPQLFIIKF